MTDKPAKQNPEPIDAYTLMSRGAEQLGFHGDDRRLVILYSRELNEFYASFDPDEDECEDDNYVLVSTLQKDTYRYCVLLTPDRTELAVLGFHVNRDRAITVDDLIHALSFCENEVNWAYWNNLLFACISSVKNEILLMDSNERLVHGNTAFGLTMEKFLVSRGTPPHSVAQYKTNAPHTFARALKHAILSSSEYFLSSKEADILPMRVPVYPKQMKEFYNDSSDDEPSEDSSDG